MAALEDYQKFLSIKFAAQREFRTLEFFHPDVGIFAPLRFVADFKSATFILEPGAPRNAGQMVVFEALSMKINEPAENLEGLQLLSMQIGATNDELQNFVDQITVANRLVPIECIYRKYYSGNLTAPVLVLYLSISNLIFDGYESNSITAEDQDISRKSSGSLYTLARFPGLRDI